MKKPLTPPSVRQLLDSIDDDRMSAVMAEGRPLAAGKYLHWDEVRHRKPPNDLSLEEWWLSIKFARMSARETLPLIDKDENHFGFVYIPAIREGLHRIDQSIGVTGDSSEVGDLVNSHGRRYILSNSFMEEAIRSSQLEGASTTRADAKDMIRERREPEDRSERMILNNYFAMERIEEFANEALTQNKIFELHSILCDGTLDDPAKAGVFRTDEDNIVVGLIHAPTKTAHIPPPAPELPARMERLLEFANGSAPGFFLHPVLRAITLHFMVGYDHPFVDGNGRVARALFYWVMMRHGYPLSKFLSISQRLRKAPAKYQRAYLYTETDGSDITYFINHQIDVIIQSIDALVEYVERKVEATRKVEEALQEVPDLNHRQIALLGHALRHPGFEYTVKSHKNSHRVVANTARSDLTELAERDLLFQAREGRKFIFIAPKNLQGRIKGYQPQA